MKKSEQVALKRLTKQTKRWDRFNLLWNGQGHHNKFTEETNRLKREFRLLQRHRLEMVKNPNNYIATEAYLTSRFYVTGMGKWGGSMDLRNKVKGQLHELFNAKA